MRTLRGAHFASSTVALLPVCVLLLVAQCSTTRGGYDHSREVRLSPGQRVVSIARKYVGVPYRFGGKTPASGFDCSGYTRYVMARAGRRIPSGARNQFRQLRRVRRPLPGDLVFFRTKGNQISHVGIYVGNYRFLHAPRSGRRVGYDDMRKKYWRKRYAGARAVF